jgi:hypothetical protein
LGIGGSGIGGIQVIPLALSNVTFAGLTAAFKTVMQSSNNISCTFMKKHFYLGVFIAVVTLCSAFKNDRPQQHLIGKWKFDAEATKKTLEKIFKPGQDPQADQLAKTMIEYLFMQMQGSTVEYQPEGVLITTLVNEETKETKTTQGSWRMDEGTNELVVVENSSKKREQRLKVISISSTQMELELKGSTNADALVMVYAK